MKYEIANTLEGSDSPRICLDSLAPPNLQHKPRDLTIFSFTGRRGITHTRNKFLQLANRWQAVCLRGTLGRRHVTAVSTSWS